MKLTNQTVKWFEDEQKRFGTRTAMYNLIYTVAADILHGIGVKKIKTSEK